MPTWRELQDGAARELSDAAIAAADAEARWMVEEASGRHGGALILAYRVQAPAVAATRVETMVARRLAGEPLQYVLGSWAFLDLDVMVDPRVLIPRPETEVTARVAIDEAERLGAQRGKSRPQISGVPSRGRDAFVIVDLGTGSGVLAAPLVTSLRDVDVWATDVSTDALAVARANLTGAGSAAARVRLAEGDWFAALPDALRGQVRLIVANPPYVAEPEMADLPPEVANHEPALALASGTTGLDATRRIIADAPDWLDAGGTLVCEISSRRHDEAVAIARLAGFTDVRVERDLLERDRVLVARRS